MNFAICLKNNYFKWFKDSHLLIIHLKSLTRMAYLCLKWLSGIEWTSVICFWKLNLSVSGNNNYSSSTNKNHCISCLTEQDRALTSVRMGAKMTSQKIYYVCLYIKIKYWLIIFCLTCSKDISDQIHYISFDIVLLNLFKNFHCCWNSRNRITWPKN